MKESIHKKKYKKYAKDQAKLAIKKYLQKNPQEIGTTPNLEKIKRIKAQTVEPWKRILMLFCGIIALWGAVVMIKSDKPVPLIFLVIGFAFGFFAFGIFGNKKTIDEILIRTGEFTGEVLLRIW